MSAKKPTPKKVNKPAEAGKARGGGDKAPQVTTPKEPAPLNPRQLRFIDEYLVDLNGTQAAIRAGYSPKGAEVASHRLLRDERVAAIVAERTEKRVAKLEITAERVLQETARLAFLDIRKAFDEDGNLKPMHELDDDTAAAIAGLDVFEEWQGRGQDREYLGRVKKLKLSDKKGALELLARHLGLLNDKLKLGVDPEDPLAALLRQVAGTGMKPKPNPARS